ncbi:MAG: acyltransferase family protein [Oscillospiraceae bacterium]|nr:acyltransferase family protein [Oscillospiraceae bacterium]
MVTTAISAAIIVFTLLILVCGVRFAKKREFFEDYFSVSQTQSIKGMCALLILLSHICMYLADTYFTLYAFKYMGAIMVAGFFFVSGYGLQYGLMNKNDYLKGFFSKRMLSIAVPFYIINIFYIVTNNMDFQNILISLTGFNLWFVMAIAIFYIGFYICGKLFVSNRQPIAMTVFVVLYIIIMNLCGLGLWWTNSCLAFAAGIWVCYGKDAFTRFFQKQYFLKTLIMFIIFALSYVYYSHHNNDRTLPVFIITVINTTSFALLLMVLSMKIQLGNMVLRFLGKMSLELYLTHALWITWLRMGFWYNLAPTHLDKDEVYLVCIIAGTVVMSVLVHTVSGLILNILLRKPHKSIEKKAEL